MPLKFDLNRGSSDAEASWFSYEDAPEGESLTLLIAPLTPLIDEECIEKSTQQPANVNGRFRRQVGNIRFRQGLYKRLVFQKTVQDWRHEPGTVALLQDQHGVPLVCSEEAKALISETHNGILDFGFDIATMLGQITAEQIQEERARFRGVLEVSDRSPKSQLPDVRETD